MAQARTTATLLGLDGSRKRRPLKLLYELGLLSNEDEPINKLTNAGLDNADLSEITLHNVCLSRADLRRTDLGRADLEGAHLSWTDLSKADLSNTRLEGANLLPYDEKDPAGLSRHNVMNGADLNVPRLTARLTPSHNPYQPERGKRPHPGAGRTSDWVPNNSASRRPSEP
jgi:uncharacterized protein YjbI with pentapeptide repeats